MISMIFDGISMGFQRDEVKTATGWRCDEGYSGTVHVACALEESCAQKPPILTGAPKTPSKLKERPSLDFNMPKDA